MEDDQQRDHADEASARAAIEEERAAESACAHTVESLYDRRSGDRSLEECPTEDALIWLCANERCEHHTYLTPEEIERWYDDTLPAHRVNVYAGKVYAERLSATVNVPVLADWTRPHPSPAARLTADEALVKIHEAVYGNVGLALGGATMKVRALLTRAGYPDTRPHGNPRESAAPPADATLSGPGPVPQYESHAVPAYPEGAPPTLSDFVDAWDAYGGEVDGFLADWTQRLGLDRG